MFTRNSENFYIEIELDGDNDDSITLIIPYPLYMF